MHLRRSWIGFAAWASCLAPFAAQALVVYKWTDAQGVLHFSDQPVPGAEKVTTSSSSANAGILGQAAPSGGTAPREKPKTATSLSSAKVSITSPGPQQTFSGGEQVPVALAMDPEPKTSWTVAWTLNGAQVQGQAPDAMQFTLTDLARGVYTIEATVTDTSTGESKAADPVTFNVLRPSLLSPQHK